MYTPYNQGGGGGGGGFQQPGYQRPPSSSNYPQQQTFSQGGGGGGGFQPPTYQTPPPQNTSSQGGGSGGFQPSTYQTPPNYPQQQTSSQGGGGGGGGGFQPTTYQTPPQLPQSTSSQGVPAYSCQHPPTPPSFSYSVPTSTPAPTYSQQNTCELVKRLYTVNATMLSELKCNYHPSTNINLDYVASQSQVILTRLMNLRRSFSLNYYSKFVKEMNDLLYAIVRDPQYASFAADVKNLVDQMKPLVNFNYYYCTQQQQPYQQQPYQQQSYQQSYQQMQRLIQNSQQQQQQQPATNPNLKYCWNDEEIKSIIQIHTKDEAYAKFKDKCWDIPGWANASNLYNEWTERNGNAGDSADSDDDSRNPGVLVLAAMYTNMLLPPLKEVAEHNGAVTAEMQRCVMQISNTGMAPVRFTTPAILYSGEPVRYTEIADCRGLRRRYTQTEVYVVEGDTLNVTRGAQKAFPEERVVVLNMTAPSRPGGWWERGGLGQEETLFMQTALSRVLSPSHYPLGDFTAIYTPGVAVVRGGLSSGFPFLSENEVWYANFVSVAGVNLWDKKTKTARKFTDRTAVTVRGKVEAILAACAKNGADVLILGALGCGAFMNPPRDISAIFRAVLEQYAGFFRKVIFAIYDSPTAGAFAEELLGRRYAKGMPLEAETETQGFQDRIWKLPRWELKAPYPGWEMPAPSAALEPCSQYGECTSIDPAHYARYAHPPLCPHGRDCADLHPVHRLMFMHVKRCPGWGLCEVLYSSDVAAVRAHVAHFDHPRSAPNAPYFGGASNTPLESVPEVIPVLGAPQGISAQERDALVAELRRALGGLCFCPLGGLCSDTTAAHLEMCIHLPVCPEGLLCAALGDKRHQRAFRHLRAECAEGKCCTQAFTDAQHWAATNHCFARPCPCAPYPCGREGDPEHMRLHSHLCKHGFACNNTDPEHLRAYFHAPAAQECPAGAGCRDRSEGHLAEFYHPDVSPYAREPCPAGLRCTNTSIIHCRKYSHAAGALEHAPTRSHNMRDPKSEGEYGVWNQKDYPVNFVRNTEAWLAKLHRDKKFHPDPAGKNFRDVVAWFAGLRPVHMLSAATLLSVAELGSLSSLERLRSLWTEKRTLAACVLARETVVAHLRKIEKMNDLRKKVRKFLALHIRTIQRNRVDENLDGYVVRLTELMNPKDPPASKEEKENNKKEIANYKFARDLYNMTKPLIPDKAKELVSHRADIVSAYEQVEPGAGESFVKTLEAEAEAMVAALHDLIDPQKSARIGTAGFYVDEEVRTNYTVFAVVGPHLDNYGWAEAALVLDQSIMYHPDYYMLPNAATLYKLGRYHDAKYGTGSLMDRTPWMGDSAPFDAEGGGRDSLRAEKFHPIAPRWAEAAATEFMARTMCSLESAGTPVASIDAVTREQVIKYWEGCNSHCVIEGHLPASVPLSYVEKAFIQEHACTEIAKSPVGAALLAKWEKAKILEVVPDAAAVRSRNEAYFAKPRPLAAPLTGFTFTLAGETQNEAFIPLELPLERDAFAVRFAARGCPFMVAVSNVGDIKGPLKAPNLDPEKPESYVPRRAVTFALDASGQLLAAHRVMPGACVTSNVCAKALDFNDHTPCRIAAEGGEVTEPVYYEIRFDYSEKTIAFRHWGPSAVYNAAEVKVAMEEELLGEKEGFNRYSYVSFANNSSGNYLAAPLVVISNLNVYLDQN